VYDDAGAQRRQHVNGASAAGHASTRDLRDVRPFVRPPALSPARVPSSVQTPAEEADVPLTRAVVFYATTRRSQDAARRQLAHACRPGGQLG